MKKLKNSSFSFYKKFLSIMFFCAVFTNGFFITRAFAFNEDITQINFVTLPQEIMLDTFSSIITIQAQNTNGESLALGETGHLVLSSTSSTGVFYNANSDSCTDELTNPFKLTINSNWSKKGFCYKDITSGTHTITAYIYEKDWTPITQDIVIIGEEESTPNIFTEITEDIIEDMTWTKENSPYVVSSSINIQKNATLNIEAGVIVKFDTDTYLIVDGALNALGTEEFPVVFTSINDDTVGGDTNDDGESVGSENDWGSILFKSIDKESRLENSISRYSFGGITSYYSAGLEILGLDIDNEILYFGSVGILENIKSTGLYLYDGSELIVKNLKIEKENKYLILLEQSKLDLSDSSINGNNTDLVSVYNKSEAIFDNVSLSNMYEKGMVFYVYQESDLSLNNSDILSNYSGLDISKGSYLNFKNSVLYCDNDGIYVYNNSVLDMDNGEVSCLHDGILIYGNTNANIKNSKISDSLDVGILVFSNDSNSDINILKSEIFNNEYGFVVFNSGIKVNDNYIHDNFSYGAFTNTILDLDFTSNFWGDKSGPAHSSNVPGLGDSISDHILYDPFLKYNPLEKRKDPVILIPGITGTYLYKDYDDYDEIWPNAGSVIFSIRDSFLKDLSLDYNGEQNLNKPIINGDIIRSIESLGVHVFDLLIEDLINQGYVENENLFVFPYDWRFSTFESSDLLKDKIDNILLNGEYEKVDIVAHSMGGLISKEYISKYGKDKIDQLIFLGTPQLGAPKAFKALEYGDSMGFEKFEVPLLRPKTAKFISQNMPSVYELLPSRKYIDKDEGYIIDNRDKEFIRLDYDQTKNLMIEDGRNPLMYPFAEDLHSTIDDLDLSGMETYNFVGCGFGTIGGIEFTKKLSWKKLFLEEKDDYNIIYTDGDETVPLVSAINTIGSKIYFTKGFSHGSLPTSPEIREGILSLLKDGNVEMNENITEDVTSCKILGKIPSVHSPASLHIYDEDGNHTGVNEDGDVEYGIEGVSFDMIDDVSYAFLPDGEDYKVIIKAEDTGGYDLRVEEQDGDTITDTKSWSMVPLKTLESTSELIFGDGEYSLLVDDNGDGEIDNTYEESFDGTEEAKKITTIKKSTGSYSGNYLVNNYKTSNIYTPEVKNLVNQSGKMEDINEDQIYLENEKTEEIEDMSNENEEEYRDVIDEDKLLASVGDTKTSINLLWPALVLFGFLLILLAKMFIKL
ncbi:MAG: hypothetical protein O210_OD1C00001G0716 [Parcubacteria bacterium RAAC4_OD1_1]|nr:MAG: hypothetical protein O210_OD1C00001G0716 [Parcubacteria bacterium RAAC4_OD1_1]